MGSHSKKRPYRGPALQRLSRTSLVRFPRDNAPRAAGRGIAPVIAASQNLWGSPETEAAEPQTAKLKNSLVFPDDWGLTGVISHVPMFHITQSLGIWSIGTFTNPCLSRLLNTHKRAWRNSFGYRMNGPHHRCHYSNPFGVGLSLNVYIGLWMLW